ncbi:stage VI sporulation protein D [Robertmurraya beringensis]|uniref:Stage VI sporulation protein D n=1 Tax=Robertmurraya beringensis TaxID=641660 RepID=A0ABV6KLU9_9BACI
MSQGNESCLRFSLEESVWFQKGQEVEELVSISLAPNITIHENEQYVTIQGALELTGEYQRYNDGSSEEEDLFTAPKFVHHVEEREEGLYEFSHRFPVDITIPNNRIQSINDIYVEVESFDYLFQERSCMKLTADLTITGLYGDQQHKPAHEETEVEEFQLEVANREATVDEIEDHIEWSHEQRTEEQEEPIILDHEYEPFAVEARKSADDTEEKVVSINKSTELFEAPQLPVAEVELQPVPEAEIQPQVETQPEVEEFQLEVANREATVDEIEDHIEWSHEQRTEEQEEPIILDHEYEPFAVEARKSADDTEEKVVSINKSTELFEAPQLPVNEAKEPEITFSAARSEAPQQVVEEVVEEAPEVELQPVPEAELQPQVETQPEVEEFQLEVANREATVDEIEDHIEWSHEHRTEEQEEPIILDHEYEPFAVEARKSADDTEEKVVSINKSTELFEAPQLPVNEAKEPEITFSAARSEAPQEVVEEVVEEAPEVELQPVPEAEIQPQVETQPEVEEESSSSPPQPKVKKKKSSKKGMSLTEFFARKEETEDLTKLRVAIVQSGETIEQLASRYEVPVQQLLKVNHLELNQDIYEGQVLYIPIPIAHK